MSRLIRFFMALAAAVGPGVCTAQGVTTFGPSANELFWLLQLPMSACAVLALLMLFRLRSFLYLFACVIGIALYLGVGLAFIGAGGAFVLTSSPWVLFSLLALAFYISVLKTSETNAPGADSVELASGGGSDDA
jgi:hypothetical protein